MPDAPFKVGDRLGSDQLIGWSYKGITGKPGVDAYAARRFEKGVWLLEVRAHKNTQARTQVLSIRTQDQDARHWADTRSRLMRHK